MNELGKIPPQAIDVEEAVLGALMLQSDAFHAVRSILKPESFYKEEHRKIFSVINELASKEKPIDLLVVTRLLKDRGELEEVGGPLYITQLTSRVASAAHIEHHSRIIAQKFIQRELIRIGSETVSLGFEDTLDLEDQLENLKSKVNEIENISCSSNTGKSQFDVLRETVIEIEQDCGNEKSGKPAGINTGFSILNQSTGGWRKTNLIIIAARPGVGKTSLALHFAKVAAQNGQWINFYGLEMTSEDLMRIVISSESGVSRSDIRDGKLQEDQWDQINLSAGKLEKLPIIWYDNAGITAGQINANTRRNSKRGRCDLVIIDYLQLMSPTDKKASREQQVSEITRNLKRTGLEAKVPIICLSQLNREASEGKPQLHHLRESGAIEQDADVVIFPWRDQDENYQLTIAKNRRGKKGTFQIIANEEMTCFDNYNPNSVPFPVIENEKSTFGNPF